jgi:hypothetical protein
MEKSPNTGMRCSPLSTETVSGRTQTDGPTEITDLDQTEENKALAVALIEDVLMGKNPAKITDYISAESYAQHNPYIKDGLSGSSRRSRR